MTSITNTKYGFQESGEYLTPYEHTVIYDSENVFQTAVAVCAYRPQVCHAGQIPQYISPKVIVFSSDDKKIRELLSAGYQCVVCISPTAPSINDKVIHTTSANFHDVITLTPGMTHAYIMEIALSLEYENYTSELVSKQDAIDFNLALSDPQTLYNYTTWNGIQRCDALIESGRNIRKYRESLANKILATGTFYNDNGIPTYVVCDREFKYELIQLSRTHLRTAAADVIIIHHLDYAKKCTDVTIVARTQSIDALDYAKKLVKMINWTGNSIVAHGLVPCTNASPLVWN
jgi:hypothetical protein